MDYPIVMDFLENLEKHNGSRNRLRIVSYDIRMKYEPELGIIF